MRGLSSIRVLALSDAGPSYYQSFEALKVVGLWGSLQSLALSILPESPGTLLPPPSFALREFHGPSMSGYDSPDTAQWILKRSVGVLEHCTLGVILSVRSLRTTLSDHFSTIRSLTLGQVQWDEEVCDVLYNFANLIELRIVQFICLMGPRFPGKLPNTLQYLTFAIPAYKGSTSPHRNIEFKNIIPTQLKTYTTIFRETGRLNNEYDPFTAWAKGYEQDCRHMGVDVRVISLRASIPGGAVEIPPAMVPRPVIPRASDVIEPTPSQLDLTEFDVVYTRKGPLKVGPSPPCIGTTTASGAKGKRKPLFARLFKKRKLPGNSPVGISSTEFQGK